MTDTTVLLSQELRDKVNAKVRACLDIAEKEYNQKFEMPVIRYDIKNTHGGLAIMPSYIIRLNLILLVENEDHFINQTVPHEVAHLVNRRVNKVPEGKKRLMPHGREWQAVMKLFGLEPEVTHSYSTASIDRSGRKARGSVKRAIKTRVDRAISMLNTLSEDELREVFSVVGV